AARVRPAIFGLRLRTDARAAEARASPPAGTLPPGPPPPGDLARPTSGSVRNLPLVRPHKRTPEEDDAHDGRTPRDQRHRRLDGPGRLRHRARAPGGAGPVGSELRAGARRGR